MVDAIVLTILGMGTVVIVLYIISLMIRLMGKVVGSKKPAAAAAPAAAPKAAAPAPAAAPKADDTKIVAVINHIFFIHSSVNGYFGCFHVLAIVNSAVMNIGVHVYLFWPCHTACGILVP